MLRSGVPIWMDAKELAWRFPASAEMLLACGAGSRLGVPETGEDGIDAVLSVAFSRERARQALVADECASVL